ncbi:hypothetical protein P0136_07805 [Lentisphaerota bacterium ZTH]|nr:hypothetical protein JYG24_01080 [Lentisphaerota bacterium]WET05269.1 hypothetical protein P0136_07805 [Lentisphaerota bacterium ZTH]
MKTRTVMMLIAAGVLSTAMTTAAQAVKSDDNANDVKKCKGDRKHDRGKMRKYLKEKYPEEMKKIKELHKTDPKAAKAKFKELVKKAVREMPPEMKAKMKADMCKRSKWVREKMKYIMYAREKYPEEFKSIRKMREDNPEAFKVKMKELLDKAKKEMPKDWKPKKDFRKTFKHHHNGMKMLQTKYGKEMDEIRKLRKTDPKAAREKFKALKKKAKAEFKAEREKFITLVKKYRETKDPKLLEQIKADVTQSTERRLEFKRKMIAKMQERIAAENKKLQEDEAKKDEIVKKRVQQIVQDPNLTW